MKFTCCLKVFSRLWTTGVGSVKLSRAVPVHIRCSIRSVIGAMQLPVVSDNDEPSPWQSDTQRYIVSHAADAAAARRVPRHPWRHMAESLFAAIAMHTTSWIFDEAKHSSRCILSQSITPRAIITLINVFFKLANPISNTKLISLTNFFTFE